MRALQRLIDNTGGVVTFNNNNFNDPAVGFAIATVSPNTKNCATYTHRDGSGRLPRLAEPAPRAGQPSEPHRAPLCVPRMGSKTLRPGLDVPQPSRLVSVRRGYQIIRGALASRASMTIVVSAAPYSAAPADAATACCRFTSPEPAASYRARFATD